MQTTAIQPHRQAVTSIYCLLPVCHQRPEKAPKLSEKFLVLESRSQEYVHVKRFVLHTASSSSQHLCRCPEK